MAAAPTTTDDTSTSTVSSPEVEVSRYTIESLLQRTGDRNRGQGVFELESNYMLEINLNESNTMAWIKKGSMVAQRGQIRLKRQGVREQGFGKVMKKALTGEGITLVKTEGLGKLYCADQKKMISIIELDNDSLSVNGNDILALSASLQYDIKFIKGAGMIAGGLFNCRVSGSGLLAFTSHGPVLTFKATPENPVYTDPQATVAWTHDPQLKRSFGGIHVALQTQTDLHMKMLIGRTTGEEVQLMFRQGIVVIQPYEEIVTLEGAR